MCRVKLPLILLALVCSLTKATLLAHDAVDHVATVGISTDFENQDKAILVEKHPGYDQFSQTTKNIEHGAKTSRATSNDDAKSEKSGNTKSDSATTYSVIAIISSRVVIVGLLWGMLITFVFRQMVYTINMFNVMVILWIAMWSCSTILLGLRYMEPKYYTKSNVMLSVLVASAYGLFILIHAYFFKPELQYTTWNDAAESFDMMVNNDQISSSSRKVIGSSNSSHTEGSRYRVGY